MLSELAFSTEDLALTRFAASPMWEVVTSFRLLATASAHPVHRPWLDQVRPRAAAAGLDRGWLARLIPRSGYLPDFLTPPAGEPAPDLATELAAIRATPADRVRADLDVLGRDGPRHRALRADPETRLGELCEEIQTYWDVALAPYWAKIRALLDADVFHRARQVAERGTGYLFNELHSTLSWDDNTLRMVRRHCGISRETAGRGLLLVPSAFADKVYTWSSPPEPPQLAYPARGTGTLWEHRPVTRAEAIAAVLGRSRTLLLTELAAPASTTELARRTGISAAGVSQHLTALRDAGMVSAHRAGRSVLYARTAIAESLLGTAA
ncbi:winged helix-turn-helix domain-containing protein [Actinoallomurus purpureus]|uniref:ArsR/SmtB family transcription factor n=1 Tax=Actinoallomurus purpureus TaxID=478114 RepID=UPI002092507B|nr:helix-turn-helix domain-containing protein [Actinoallomurus purpureus]MCO6009102.1 winged helix-turn-helix domain-containing protein [Actinoallomurus purpureus]